MGAFLLINKDLNKDISSVKQFFSNRGYNSFIEKTVGSFSLLLYRKKIVNQINFRENGDVGIYVTGTLIYKGYNYTKSLDNIITDLQYNKFESNKLLGHYSIIYFNSINISLITDPYNIYNIYFSDDKKIISSSFLALSKLVSNEIDYFAAQEILLTGMNHGEKTLLKSIKRLYFTDNNKFPSLELIKPSISWNNKIYKNKNEAVVDQLNVLEKYFSTIKSIANENGVDSGLTGGFDSRLIFLMCKRFFNNFQIHSHWRKNPSKEFHIAHSIAQYSGYELKSIPVITPNEMDEEQFVETLKESMYFYDGHLRAYAYWYEEYNTEKYRMQVLGDKKLGLNGIGGEQYRNQERMCLPFWNFRTWVRNEVIKNNFNKVFIDYESEREFIDEISKKIAYLLGYTYTPKFINHRDIKKYYAEIYVPGLRGIRASCENQYTYFLSPFADPYVAKSAYNIIPYLGWSLNFEAKMIRQLCKKIAYIESDHGFNFINGEPIWKALGASVIVNVCPHSIKTNLIYKKRGQDRIMNFENLLKNLTITREYLEEVEALSLPIDISVIKKRQDLNHLLISMGYLLKKLKTGDI